jgi:hypothetical protein
MNLVLLLVVIAGLSIGWCAWYSPVWLRAAAARMMARAEAVEEQKRTYARRLTHWRAEFGVES